MIATKTPLRISLGGGGTDIRSAVDVLGEPGAVVNLAIDKYVYVFIKKHSSVFSERYRLNYSKSENTLDRSQIQNKIIKACLEYLDLDEPLYIGSAADVPAGTGLGSSSAFTVGLLNALHIYRGDNTRTQIELAKEAVDVEVNILKSPIGIQDQFGCAMGGLKHFLIKKNNEFELIEENKTPKDLKWLTDRLFLVWTKNTRDANHVLRDQQKRVIKNKVKLATIKQDSFNFMKAFLELREDVIEKIIINGWLSKKQLSPHILTQEIDDMSKKISSMGINSFRILGAGGGGFLMCWGKQELVKKLKNHSDLDLISVMPDTMGTRGMEI